MNDTDQADSTPASTSQWRPLPARQRRVLGTLMEKSKTTPDAYPLTILALTTGCNQKSNRFPVNNYSLEQIEESVNQMKLIGAVVLVHGNGRVPKVRHLGYQWLGVDKVEAAVMTELLLRGQQTLGELRSRASRMEPIDDMAHLQQLLEGLQQRNLVLYLTPPGRGQIVSHNLYPEHERQALLDSIGQTEEHSQSDDDPSLDHGRQPPITAPPTSTPTPSPSPSGLEVTADAAARMAEMQQAIRDLTNRLAFLEEQLGVQWPGDQLDKTPSE